MFGIHMPPAHDIPTPCDKCKNLFEVDNESVVGAIKEGRAKDPTTQRFDAPGKQGESDYAVTVELPLPPAF